MTSITRFEVIDHTEDQLYCTSKHGRRYLVVGPCDAIEISTSLQDDGRTLKVFINDRHN